MRRILYPLILLIVIGLIGYFTWEHLTSFWKKGMIIIGVVVAFWLLKNIIGGILGFFLKSFSWVIRLIITLALVILCLWLIWSFLIPQNIKDSFFSVPNKISETIKDGAEEIENGVENIKDKAQDKTDEAKDNTKNLVSIDDLFNDKYSDVSKEKEFVDQNEENNNERSEKDDEKNSLQNTSEGDDRYSKKEVEERKSWKDSKNSTEKDASDKPDNEVSDNKDIELETSSKIIKNNEIVENTVDLLTQTGPEDSTKEEVEFRLENAKMVFPEGFEIQDFSYQTGDDFLESVSFKISRPFQDKVAMNVTIYTQEDGNEFFVQYEREFRTQTNGENTFILTQSGTNSSTYITFFEGKLWQFEIAIDSDTVSEEDFLRVLSPILFETRFDGI